MEFEENGGGHMPKNRNRRERLALRGSVMIEN
jgi:hypothetical protein